MFSVGYEIFAPSFVFHNQHKTLNNLYIAMVSSLSACRGIRPQTKYRRAYIFIVFSILIRKYLADIIDLK